MWRSKKFIIAAAAAVILVVTLAGVAFAQTESTDTSKTLLGRVAAILGIDQQRVEDAFTQAQKEMQAEALDAYLKKLVEDGRITQGQADQYKTWWGARPDTPLNGPFGRFGGRCFGGGRWGGYRIGPGVPSPSPSPSATN